MPFPALLLALAVLTGCATAPVAPPVERVVVRVPDGGYRWSPAIEWYVWCADADDSSCRQIRFDENFSRADLIEDSCP